MVRLETKDWEKPLARMTWEERRAREEMMAREQREDDEGEDWEDDVVERPFTLVRIWE